MTDQEVSTSNNILSKTNNEFRIEHLLANNRKIGKNYSHPKVNDRHSHRVTKTKRRIRTTFSKVQLEILESQFNQQQYMVGDDRIQLARQLQLRECQVKVWFQNRRIRWRRDQHDRMLITLSNVDRQSTNVAEITNRDSVIVENNN